MHNRPPDPRLDQKVETGDRIGVLGAPTGPASVPVRPVVIPAQVIRAKGLEIRVTGKGSILGEALCPLSGSPLATAVTAQSLKGRLNGPGSQVLPACVLGVAVGDRSPLPGNTFSVAGVVKEVEVPRAALGTPVPGTGTGSHSPVAEEEVGVPVPAPGLLQVTERRRKYRPPVPACSPGPGAGPWASGAPRGAGAGDGSAPPCSHRTGLHLAPLTRPSARRAPEQHLLPGGAL